MSEASIRSIPVPQSRSSRLGEGWARVYGHNTITVDPADDPYWRGFTVT